MTHQPTIAIDLDGTIAVYKNEWKGIHDFGKPMPKVREAITLFQKAGLKILIFTTRTNPEVNKEQPRYLKDIVERYLVLNNIPFDEIYCGPGKPLCDFFLDDRAIAFVDWDNAIIEVMSRYEQQRKGYGDCVRNSTEDSIK